MVTKIAVMRTLMDHPNMLKLHGVFEDEEGFHVVLEYCKGAPLLDAIHDKVSAVHPGTSACWAFPAFCMGQPMSDGDVQVDLLHVLLTATTGHSCGMGPCLAELVACPC
jgi:serine/threonine protein kinase